MIDLDALIGEDETKRAAALHSVGQAPDYVRAGIATKLGPAARAAAAALAAEGTPASASNLERLLGALAVLRVASAKHCLLRIADEGGREVKATLARALHGNTTAEGRAVLVHLLSDGESRDDALAAIAKRPWTEVLPALIELAEADGKAAELAIGPIAECGSRGTWREASAAVDFLFEQLDDDAMAVAATVALVGDELRRAFPELVAVAKKLAIRPESRRFACLCVVAADASVDDASLAELVRAGGKYGIDAARRQLEPFRAYPDDRIRASAERVVRALA